LKPVSDRPYSRYLELQNFFSKQLWLDYGSSEGLFPKSVISRVGSATSGHTSKLQRKLFAGVVAGDWIYGRQNYKLV
jgi:hypothetical protein